MTKDDEQFPKITGRFHKFAEWVFGPEGFPSMKVLTAGDFSHRGRSSETNVLLCRREEPAPTEGTPGRFLHIKNTIAYHLCLRISEFHFIPGLFDLQSLFMAQCLSHLDMSIS